MVKIVRGDFGRTWAALDKKLKGARVLGRVWQLARPVLLTLHFLGLFCASILWSGFLLGFVDQLISPLGTTWFWILAGLIGVLHIAILTGGAFGMRDDFRKRQVIELDAVLVVTGMILGGVLAVWWVWYGATQR